MDEKRRVCCGCDISYSLFVIRGIILPVINRVGGKNTDKPAQVQAETDTNANTNTGDSGTETQIEKDTNAAIRKPLKGASDLTKASQLTAGWHEDENGKWYQNVMVHIMQVDCRK